MTSRLHLTVDGPAAAPVLLLGSSLGTAAAMWEPQVPLLAERFRVIRYDHLGHGRSAVPAGPYTLDLLGRELLRTLDDLDLRWVHYAGLSLGGMVGMWLAAHAPDRVRRLALLCTSASLGPAGPWRERAATVRAGGLPAIADAVVARWFTPAFAAARPGRGRRTPGHADRDLPGRIRGLLRGDRRDGPPPRPGPDRHADPGRRGRGRPGDPGGARPGDRRTRPRGAAGGGRRGGAPGQRRADPCRWADSCGNTSRNRVDDGRPRAARDRHDGTPAGARRRARRPRGRRHRRVHRRLPGLHHPLRVGRGVDPARSRPAYPQLHHPRRARHPAPRRGVGDARAGRAGQRAERAGGGGGPAPGRRLRWRTGGEPGVHGGPGGTAAGGG